MKRILLALIVILFPLQGQGIIGLPELEKQLQIDLELLDYPPIPWRPASAPCYDVVIIGAGMAGNSAAFALMQLGITNIQLFDAQPSGLEGPWKNYARMQILRSGKTLIGPALGLPSLTFQAWYKDQYGIEGWKQMHKIPTGLWSDYLQWYGKALALPIRNSQTVKCVKPVGNLLGVELANGHQVLARKVVFATGREGFGGSETPELVKLLSKKYWAHTSEKIDFDGLRGKRVCIVGIGASSFDAAAVALETGAKQVDLLMRRAHLPTINKFVNLTFLGATHGFYSLSDEQKLRFLSHAFENGIPAPVDSLQRVNKFKTIALRANTRVESLKERNGEIMIQTNHGVHCYDYLILGTGFAIDITKQPEMRGFSDQIVLWGDHALPFANEKLKRFPYLGPHFQFIAKNPEASPYIKNIYCFNYAAILSHGLISSDVMGISVGASRLAQGIAKDLFVEDSEQYYQEMVEDQWADYQEEDFSFVEVSH